MLKITFRFNIFIADLPSKRILKKNAVPTLHLNVVVTKSASSISRKERFHEKQRKSLVNEMLIAENNMENVENDAYSLEKNWESKYLALLGKYKLLEEKYENLSKSCRMNCLRHKKLINHYRKKYAHKQSAALTLMKKVLSENQISLLSKKRKKVFWTAEEISNAITLRYLSRKAYLFLNNTLKYPLPSLSSIKRWANRIHIRCGILTDVMKFLNIAGETMSSFEKTLVISFDEIKVKSVWEYDIVEDEVLKPYNFMQVSKL